MLSIFLNFFKTVILAINNIKTPKSRSMILEERPCWPERSEKDLIMKRGQELANLGKLSFHVKRLANKIFPTEIRQQVKNLVCKDIVMFLIKKILVKEVPARITRYIARVIW